MGEPAWVEVDAPSVTLRGPTWKPRRAAADAPIALCLHGFPDTAHGWRKVAPKLAAAGWRVVAPFMRGYAPSTIPSDGSYHIGALMNDALRVLDEVGPTGRDVIIGHDWGAIAGAGLAAMPASPFSKAVIFPAPPAASFRPLGRVPHAGRLIAQIPRQLLRSWYIMYFQLPLMPERSASWVRQRPAFGAFRQICGQRVRPRAELTGKSLELVHPSGHQHDLMPAVGRLPCDRLADT